MLRADEDLNQLETVLAFFATLVLDSSLVQQIMRWDMAILRESPWYQEILKEGELRGELKGKQIGEQIGELRGKELGKIEMILEVKFNTDALQVMTEIAEISDVEKLKVIQRGIMTLNTLDEVRAVVESVKFASS